MRAIALVSGGLDSILAAKVIQGEGVEITPLHFVIPFCQRQEKGRTPVHSLTKNTLGVELKSVDLGNEFLPLIKNPRYGFGTHMNPCIDCKILMLQKAKEMLSELGASFVVTGEVLGQRPMSQHREALKLIANRSGLEGLVVRPLSAQILEETIPEAKGWIDREKLLRFAGRSRRPQLELAAKLKVTNYGTPAGGCLLTDPRFSQRLKDLLSHDELNIENIELLKIGRHFRLSGSTRLVVGRDETENNQLDALFKQGDYAFYPSELIAGPTALGRGVFNEEQIKISCRIVSRYCDLNGNKEAEIKYKVKTGTRAKTPGPRRLWRQGGAGVPSNGTHPAHLLAGVQLSAEGDCPYLNVTPLPEEELNSLRI